MKKEINSRKRKISCKDCKYFNRYTNIPNTGRCKIDFSYKPNLKSKKICPLLDKYGNITKGCKISIFENNL